MSDFTFNTDGISLRTLNDSQESLRQIQTMLREILTRYFQHCRRAVTMSARQDLELIKDHMRVQRSQGKRADKRTVRAFFLKKLAAERESPKRSPTTLRTTL